jgi:hypothetical protein
VSVAIRFEIVLGLGLLLMAACEHHAVPSSAPPSAGRSGSSSGAPSAGHAGSGPASAGRSGSNPSAPASGRAAPPPPESSSPGSVEFPLRLSDDKRHLVDHAGQPFLINQASSWGLIQSLSNDDAADYLDMLRAHGFNTVMVSVISYDVRMAGNPPAWQGTAPFTKQWDFSTPNPAYFAHADHILDLARQRDMLVSLVPCYLGFAQDPSQGWADELLSSNNDLDKSAAYGRFLGQRYKDVPNIVWVAGGDNTPAPGSLLEQHLRAIVDGIRETDGHLWTGHWNSGDTGTMATENPGFASDMDLDGYYAFNYDLTYEKDLAFYTKTPVRPVFHLDMSYETEGGGTPDNIRRKAYAAMLMGSAGSSFNAGPNWYLFSNWRDMDTPGTRETTYWFRLFASRPWYDLVPDQKHRAVTSGYGDFGSLDYVSAALSSKGETLIAYLPHGHALQVDLDVLNADQARAYWYDPTSGKAQSAGTFASQGTLQFAAPSSDSWVLVIDDAALDFPEPGAPSQ